MYDRTKTGTSVWRVLIVALLLVAIIALVFAILVGLDIFKQDDKKNMPSQSLYGDYRFAAVAADRSVCSTVGTYVYHIVDYILRWLIRPASFGS